MREVHNSHRWSQHTQQCKGCEIHISADEAKKPCAQPYKPPPRKPKEYRRP